MRPEHMGAAGKACTSCHGMDKHAPMPSDMVGRGNNCWICHNGPEFQYLFSSMSPDPSPGADEPDAVQVFAVANGAAAPLAEPVAFAGPVTALWPAAYS